MNGPVGISEGFIGVAGAFPVSASAEGSVHFFHIIKALDDTGDGIGHKKGKTTPLDRVIVRVEVGIGILERRHNEFPESQLVESLAGEIGAIGEHGVLILHVRRVIACLAIDKHLLINDLQSVTWHRHTAFDVVFLHRGSLYQAGPVVEVIDIVSRVIENDDVISLYLPEPWQAPVR